MNIQDCIIRVKQAADLTDQEAQDILDRVKAERDRLGAEGRLDRAEEALKEYAAMQGQNEQLQARLNARQTARQVIGRQKAQERVLNLVNEGLGAEEAIFADMVGTEKDIAAGRKSTDGIGRAYFGTSVGPLNKYLMVNPDVRKLLTPSLIKPEQRAASKQFLDNLIDEMEQNKPGGTPGITGDAKAQEFGQLLSRTTEAQRVALNRAGADIGKIDGWTPHTYHEGLVHKAGRDIWVDTMYREIDIEKTFPDLDTEEEIKEILGQSWHNIVMGRQQTQIKPEQKALIKGRRVSKKFEKHRFFHFKPGGYKRIHAQFGRGNVFDSVVTYLRHSSNTLAAMERYGPNPEATIDRLLTDMVKGLEKGPATDKAIKELERLRSNNLQRREGKIGAALAEVMGETFSPVSRFWAKWSQGTRNMVAMAKLGGAFLSALADAPIVNNVFKRMGLGFTERWGRTFETFFSKYSIEDRKQLSYLIDAFSDGLLGDIHSRIAMFEQGPGWTSKMSSFFYKASLLTQWTDSGKAGMARMLMAEMGTNSTKAWDSLDINYRGLLDNYGITPEKWEAIKYLADDLPADGKKYIFPERSDLIPDDVLDSLRPDEISRAKTRYKKKPKLLDASLDRIRTEARREIELDVVGYIHDMQTHGVIEPDARTRILLYGGSRPGAFSGEARRFIFQFKSFPVAFGQKVLAPAIYGRKGQSVLTKAMDTASLMAALTMFGYISMSAKQLSRGQKPADPTESWQRAFGVMGAAFLQGGGGGIYGDFLLGQYNRFGRSFPETMAGAVIGGPVADVAAIWSDLLAGEFKWGKVINLAMNNTPFINLWYTRAALDYLLLYHLQEMASPGVLSKREKRMKKYTGREFIVPPSTVISRGGGFR